MKASGKIIGRLIVGGVLACCCASKLHAQNTTNRFVAGGSPSILGIASVINSQNLQLVTEILESPVPSLSVPVIAPATARGQSGTFWTLTGPPAPLPCNPYPELPVYSLGQGNFLIDDRSVDYEALSILAAANPAPAAFSNYEAPVYTTNDLWLEMIAFTNQTASIVLHAPDANAAYDLFATTSLSPSDPGLNWTNWVWVLRSEPGQTELLVTNLAADICFFRAATTNDTDLDGLTDAYEHLASHTLKQNPDTDGDGLSDFVELQLGTDPNNAYSQDTNQVNKDGAWALTAVTGETGKYATLTLSTNDSYYDSSSDFTYCYFYIGGTTVSDQYHIYIQTPSTDPADTNLVWQDMFFNSGYYDYNFDAAGNHWFVTGWRGQVALDGSVKFAAMDYEDRDLDGLQDGFEILSTLTAAGVASSTTNGIADGDNDIAGDGVPSSKKWQYGLHPLVPVHTNDASGLGMPDWMTNYIAVWYGPDATGPWVDADGDGSPNIIEVDIGSDPTIPDLAAYSSRPDETYQFVSLRYDNIPYGEDDAPLHTSGSQALLFAAQGASGTIGNEWFTTAGFASGVQGVSAFMTVEPNNTSGAGTANFSFEIIPLNYAYGYLPGFTNDAEAEPSLFQALDPNDVSLYRNILFQSTDIAKETWARVNKDVLNALSQRTLEYVTAESRIRISVESRKIQWWHWQRLNYGETPAISMRIKKSASIIHTEMTKITAIQMKFIQRFPNLNWVGKVLGPASTLAGGASLYYSYPDLVDAINGYQSDVRRHVDEAGPAILSCTIQSMLSDIPGMPTWAKVMLYPSIPLFDPNPLGWYDGGGGY